MGVEGQKWKGDWFDVEAEDSVNVGGGNKIARLRQGHVSLSKACELVSQWQYNTHTHVSRSHDPATLASPRVTVSLTLPLHQMWAVSIEMMYLGCSGYVSGPV